MHSFTRSESLESSCSRNRARRRGCTAAVPACSELPCHCRQGHGHRAPNSAFPFSVFYFYFSLPLCFKNTPKLQFYVFVVVPPTSYRK